MGFKFVAVTSLHDDPYVQELTDAEPTESCLVMFSSSFHYLGCGADKDEILEELSYKYPRAPWIEDKPDQPRRRCSSSGLNLI